MDINLDTSRADLLANRRTTAQLDYYNRSYTGLSHSRQMTLDACPRKYELDSKYRLRARKGSVTFAYGHAVGAGIQAAISGMSEARTLMFTILEYDYDIDKVGNTSEQLSNKSLWHALAFVRRFWHLYNDGELHYLRGWEVATFQRDGETLSGVELTFVIDLGEGYTYEGHIDLVLYNPKKDRYMVLELKTTNANNVDEAQFRNSGQPIGYSVVIDNIAGNLKASSSLDVLYLIGKSKTQEMIPMPFTKTPLDKANFLMGMLLEKERVQLYEDNGFYPMHGQSCYNYFRRCEYYGKCHMPEDTLRSMEVDENSDEVIYSKLEEPTFMFHIDELLERQQQVEKYASATDTEVDMLLDVRVL